MFSLKHATLFLMLLPVCNLHAAQWQEAPSPIPNIIVYVDPASITVTDYVVRGWVKFDYRIPREYQGKQLIEETSERMVNCQERTFWAMGGYGLPKGGGNPVRVFSNAEYWMVPAPDSQDEVAYNALCDKSKSILDKAIDQVTKGVLDK